MTHINLNAQGEEVKRFFLSLPADSRRSLVELDGRVVARVRPSKNGASGDRDHDGPWTEAKNARRCTLIDREIDGTLDAGGG